MDIKEAIKQRHSVRQYKTLPLEAEAKNANNYFAMVGKKSLQKLNGLRLDWKQQFLHPWRMTSL